MSQELLLRLPPWQLVFLRELAKERNTSLPNVVRDLILKEKVDHDADLRCPAHSAEENDSYGAIAANV